jgi:ribonuclease HI
MLQVFTDGSCLGNRGADPGGFAYLIEKDGKQVILESSNCAATTNNRMELSGVIAALRKLIEMECMNETILITTDSTYVKDGIERWIHGWKRNGWTKSNGECVKNQDLWMQLDDLKSQFIALSFSWVKAHKGDLQNAIVDEEARKAAHSINQILPPGKSKRQKIN